MVVSIFIVLCFAAHLDIESFIFYNSNPSSPLSGQEPSSSTPSGQEPSSSTPSGQEPQNSPGQSNGPGPENGEVNGEDNDTQDNDSNLGASDSSSGIGPCTCCDQDQDHEGPCGCSNDCDPEVTTHYQEPATGTCCGCRIHSYSHACTDCACNYCSDCYNRRQN